jgi:hypothetical protein
MRPDVLDITAHVNFPKVFLSASLGTRVIVERISRIEFTLASQFQTDSRVRRASPVQREISSRARVTRKRDQSYQYK